MSNTSEYNRAYFQAHKAEIYARRAALDAALTPEELEAKKAKQRAYQRAYKAAHPLTDAQKAARREADRKRYRLKKREGGALPSIGPKLPQG